MKTAIKANYFSPFENVESLKSDPQVEDEEVKLLHHLANQDGWKVFTERANKVMGDLDDIVRSQMNAGADEASIGRSTIVKEITKDVIRRLFNIVTDAYDSIESRRGEGSK